MDFMEAVRLGCEHTDWAGCLVRFSNYNGKHRYAACVMGVAFIGAGLGTIQDLKNLSTGDVVVRLKEVFPNLARDMKFVCPVCPSIRSTVQLGVHLNDRHKWTRERTAAYLMEITS